MVTKKYAWKAGRSFNSDPHEAHVLFERLRKENGGLTAAHVVEDAEYTDSPVHKDFEWDDNVAGHEFRLSQGRKLIRALVVVAGSEQTSESVYVHTIDKQGQGRYETMNVIGKDPDMLSVAISEARGYLESGARRWSQIAPVARGFDEAIKVFDETVR